MSLFLRHSISSCPSLPSALALTRRSTSLLSRATRTGTLATRRAAVTICGNRSAAQSTPSSFIPHRLLHLSSSLQFTPHPSLHSSSSTPIQPSPYYSAHDLSPDSSPQSVYDHMVSSGKLRADPRQRLTVSFLEATFQQLRQAKQGGSGASRVRQHVQLKPQQATETAASSGGGGFLGFAKKLISKPTSSAAASSSSSALHSSHHSSASPFQGVPGLYLHGGVGCGKTMLMNLFSDCVLRSGLSHKCLRKHFHSFMLDIHSRLHALRKDHPGISDPISHVARELVDSECEILALDEFQVTDVADAMILKQLFGSMWSRGCIVVATSNRPPEDLYKNGLNRSVFVPFIGELARHCTVHCMEEGQDHRLLGTIDDGVYHTPVDAATNQRMDQIFDRIAGSTDPGARGPTKIKVMMGREMAVPMASRNGNIAQFSFSQLCESNVGAADYIALTMAYRYVLLTDVPILYFNAREKIRRFITFLDVAYEHHTRLIIQAAEEPLKLFQPPPVGESNGGQAVPVLEFDGAPPQKATNSPTVDTSSSTDSPPSRNLSARSSASSSSSTSSPSHGATSSSTTVNAKYDEQFASSRAISRLIEMSSKEYMEDCARLRQGGEREKVFMAELEMSGDSRTKQHLENEKKQQLTNK